MNNEDIGKRLRLHEEELSHYAIQWSETSHVFEDALQQWRDESSLSFRRTHISEIEESIGLMKSLFYDHNISLLQILTYFKEIEQVHKQLSTHLDVCKELSSRGSAIVVKGNNFDSEANEQASLAMNQIEKAISIIKEIKS